MVHRRRAFHLFVFISVLAVFACSTILAQEPEVSEQDLQLYEQGRQLHEQGQYQEALKIFNQIDKKDLGFWRNFRVDRAIEELQTQVRAQPAAAPAQPAPALGTQPQPVQPAPAANPMLDKYDAAVRLYNAGRLVEAKGAFSDLSRYDLGPNINGQVDDYLAKIRKREAESAIIEDTLAPNAYRREGLVTTRVGGDLTARQSRAVEILQKEGRLVRIADERRAFLSDHHFNVGMNYYKKFEYMNARDEFQTALDLNPMSEDALEYLEKCNTMLDVRKDKIPEYARREFEMRRAEVDRAYLEMERLYEESKRLIVDAEFDKAIEKLQSVREIVHWMPYKEDVTAYDRGTKELIDQAELLKKKHEQELDRVKSTEAAEALAEEIGEEREYKRQKIQRLMRRAEEFVAIKEYDKACDLYTEVLKLQPDHFDATMGKLDSQALLIRKRREEIKEEMTHKTQQVWLDTDRAAIPQPEVVKMPDDWDLIKKRPAPSFGKQQQEPAWKPVLDEVLDTKKVSVFFTETPLSNVLVFLAELTDVDFVADLRDTDDETIDPFVTIRVNNMTLRNALNWISTLSGTKWGLKDQAVYFSLGAVEEPVLRFYPIRDLMYQPTDFPGRNFEFAGGVDDAQVFDLGEDLDASVGFDPEMLQDFIRNIDAESWDDVDAQNRIEYHGGMLLVINTPDVHEKIQSLLAHFRSTRGLQVNMNAQFIELQDNFLEDMGVDWRGLSGRGINEVVGNTGGSDAGVLGSAGEDPDWRLRLENTPDGGVTRVAPAASGLGMSIAMLTDMQVKMIIHMVQKEQKGNILVAPKLTCFDGQRANVLVAEQITYIADYDVDVQEGATGVSPVIERALDGVSLDVRPIVSADRKFITIEVRPALARLQTPMRSETVALAGGVEGPIELPAAALKTLQTTVMIPDGGAILLGGLMDRQELSHNVGIPFLSKIPLLNNLFRKKAKGLEKRNLIFLLRAKIVDLEAEIRGAS